MELTPDEIERRRLLSRITKRFHKACADFALIEEGDHILIGLSGYRRVPKLCPYEHESTRTDVRHILDAMERINPNAKDSIWGAMTNIQRQYLPESHEL